MTNKVFVNALAEKLGKTKKETKEIVAAFEAVLKESVSAEGIKVADLNFSVKEVPARNGVNPKTQEKIVIPAYKKLYVKPSKAFRSLVKE